MSESQDSEEQGDVFDAVASHWRKSGVSMTYLLRRILHVDPKIVKRILEDRVFSEMAIELVFEHDVVPEKATGLYSIDAVRDTWIFDPLSLSWSKVEDDEFPSGRVHIPLSGAAPFSRIFSSGSEAIDYLTVAFNKLIPNVVDRGCFFVVRRPEVDGSFSMGFAFVLDSTFQGLSSDPPDWWGDLNLGIYGPPREGKIVGPEEFDRRADKLFDELAKQATSPK